MKRFVLSTILLLTYSFLTTAQEKIVTITTNVGSMKARLYEDVPNHTKTFISRAQRGDFNGTLFTRVIPGFMIQGGAADSRNAPAGAKIGKGDRSAEILPEFRSHYFHKKGALAAPRQEVNINPEKKSDMSQFFIVQGTLYTSGQLDTLEKVKNQFYRKKALDQFYYPVQDELKRLREEDPRTYNKMAADISSKIDSVVRTNPDHLIFTDEQREAYTTVGGAQHLDGEYTIFGELIEGFDVLDVIAGQERDAYDRPKKDIQIIRITVE